MPSRILFRISAAAAAVFLAAAVQAAPSGRISGNAVIVNEALNDSIAETLKADAPKIRDRKRLSIDMSRIGANADVARVAELFPDAAFFSLTSSPGVTDIKPLAALSGLTSVRLRDVGVTDLSPLAGLTKMESLDISLRGVKGDLRWMQAMKGLKRIEVGSNGFTSLEGIPPLPALNRAVFTSAAPTDLAPLVASLPGLSDLELRGMKLPDLAPLAKLAKLRELSLYGSTVKDFTPLAGCGSLRKLNWYATSGPDYATLGTLTQVEEFRGGLTKLDSLAWIEKLPNLKRLSIFAEYVTDYSPLAKGKLEFLRIWDMRKPVGDLAAVAAAKTLRELQLDSVKGATNSKALGALTGLEKLQVASYGGRRNEGEPFDCSGAPGWSRLQELELRQSVITNESALGALAAAKKIRLTQVNEKAGEPVDLSFLAKLPGLQALDLRQSRVRNFDAVASCAELGSLDLTKTEGVTSLAALKKLPKLRSLQVTKGAFPDAELTGFANPKMKVIQR